MRVRAGWILLIVTIAIVPVVAQQPQPQSQPQPLPSMPRAEAILKYLNDTIDWYRHVASQEQFVTDSSDISFVDEDKQISKQILNLSFDFARAEAQLLGKENSPKTAREGNSAPSQFESLIRAASEADNELKDTKTELDGLKQKLLTAPQSARAKLQATVDELQSEVNLAQARSQSLHNILQFATSSTASGGSLSSQIDEMERSIPELARESNKSSPPSGTVSNTGQAVVQPVPTGRREMPAGILGLVTDLFTLERKIGMLNQSIAATDTLAKASQAIRSPLIANLRTAASRGEEFAKQADSSNATELETLKKQLDALTEQFRQVSSVMIPLQRQSILIDLEKKTLTSWRDTIQGQFADERGSLLVKLTALGLAILVIVVLAEIWQRATLRYIRDARRRYQFLLLRRIAMWIAILITIAFGLATEIGSLATFAGLITAGIAVALQNVILAIAGYFFLIGKYGVRVGDRVQISGVTGNVIDIGLVRLGLLELGGSGNDRQPTGRVVVFSNSVVFQPSASFFKQIPGTNFGWHEVTFILAPQSDYGIAEQRILGVIEKVYAKYHEKIEAFARQMERIFSMPLDIPKPTSRLRLTQTGLEVVIRYPVDLENSTEIDDQFTRELLDALDQPPKLKLVGSGVPNIQPVGNGH